jgi:hypothetical protein
MAGGPLFAAPGHGFASVLCRGRFAFDSLAETVSKRGFS